MSARHIAFLFFSIFVSFPAFAEAARGSQSDDGSSAGRMELGGNFWNPGWHRPDDCFKDVKNVSGENPWNAKFLEEISLYRSLRFMDWDNCNNSQREEWRQRPAKTNAHQNPVAYEWMIDLCNRNGSALWVTVPHRAVNRSSGDAPNDYALRLCLLVKTGVDMGNIDVTSLLPNLSTASANTLVEAGGVRTCQPLRPELKLYLEYSNETWNGMFKQAHYCCDEGQALGLNTNRWTAGFRFHAWAAARLFRAADLVFGANSQRVVKVLATHSANPWIAGQHLQVMENPELNPWGVKATAIATAPYFGHNVEGTAANAVELLRTAIQQCGADSAKHKKIAAAAGMKLIAYEGGQHVTKQARAINRNLAMYELYREYLREMEKHFEHFCHYAHVGRAGEGGAWGCLEYTGQPIDEAHKYRALLYYTQ